MTTKQKPIDLYEKFKNDVVKELIAKHHYKNPNQVPKLVKIVVNRGLGEALTNAKAVQASVDEFKQIFGQQPVVTKAKKSIAGFKLREGVPIGCMVTLRGEKMYDFASKLFDLSLPKIRDFRGVSSKAFDKQGNYTLGLKEQLIFPEINFDKIEKIRGFNITFVTTAKTAQESFDLLKLLGMPFRK